MQTHTPDFSTGTINQYCLTCEYTFDRNMDKIA